METIRSVASEGVLDAQTFGEMDPQTKGEHSFQFHNTGPGKLDLQVVGATCGCIRAQPEQQVVEDRPPEPIHASNLAIEHSALNAQVLADPLSEIVESPEDVSVPGDEPARDARCQFVGFRKRFRSGPGT